MNIVQAGNRTRVVFNLNKPVGFDTKIDGNDVLITLQTSRDEHGGRSTVTSHFAEARPDDTRHTLRDVDFRRGRTAKAASSSTCPTARPASTSASRAAI